MKSNRLAVPALILATALGASSGLYIKTLPYSSLALTGFRMGVPFLFFLPLMFQRRLLLGPEENRRMIWTASFLNAVRMVLYILAYKFTTLTNAVVLLYLWPIFALVLNARRTNQKIKTHEAGLLFLALSGVILLNVHKGFSFSTKDILGSSAMIISAAIFSLTTLLFKEALAESKESEVLYYQNALGALVFIPLLILEIPAVPFSDNLLGLLYGFSVGILGFGCFFYALKRLPVFQYGALGYSEVFFGVLFGIAFLREEVRWNIILGAALILISSFLSRIGSLRKSAPE